MKSGWRKMTMHVKYLIDCLKHCNQLYAAIPRNVLDAKPQWNYISASCWYCHWLINKYYNSILWPCQQIQIINLKIAGLLCHTVCQPEKSLKQSCCNGLTIWDLVNAITVYSIHHIDMLDPYMFLSLQCKALFEQTEHFI